MNEREEGNQELQITIPITDADELVKYQQGILGLLSKIEICNCDDALKEHLIAVYELLARLDFNGNISLQQKGRSVQRKSML